VKLENKFRTELAKYFNQVFDLKVFLKPPREEKGLLWSIDQVMALKK
jgi:hypothetical protein